MGTLLLIILIVLLIGGLLLPDTHVTGAMVPAEFSA